jgi:hypothetical protein
MSLRIAMPRTNKHNDSVKDDAQRHANAFGVRGLWCKHNTVLVIISFIHVGLWASMVEAFDMFSWFLFYLDGL